MELPVSPHLSTHRRLAWTLIKVHIDSNQCNCIPLSFPDSCVTLLRGLGGNRGIPQLSAVVSASGFLGNSDATEVTLTSVPPRGQCSTVGLGRSGQLV